MDRSSDDFKHLFRECLSMTIVTVSSSEYSGFTYLLTYLLTYLPTYLLTYLLIYLLTYLSSSLVRKTTKTNSGFV